MHETIHAMLTVTVTFALTVAGTGCCATPPPSALRSIRPDFSLGLTPPVHLLKYQHQEHYPPYCRRAQVLDEIQKLAEKAQCGAVDITIGDAPTRLITCDLPSRRSSSCPTQYIALIWQERWPTSTENYNLEMYARVRIQCGQDEDFGTFRAADRDIKKMAQISEDVKDILKSCKQLNRGND